MRHCLIALSLIGLLLAACGPATPEQPPDFVLITAAGEVLEGQSAGGCWPDAASNCTVGEDPDFTSFSPLPAGGALTFERLGEGTPDRFEIVVYDDFWSVSSVASTDQVAFDDAGRVTWQPALEAGNYVVSISAEWKSGAYVGRIYAVRIPSEG